MPWGPWIQDPDITVECGRLRAMRDSGATLGSVTHTGAYVLGDVNTDVVGTTGPALVAATDYDVSGYASAIAAIGAGLVTELTIDVTRVTVPASYHLEASFSEEVLGCSAFPHGWTPPVGAEVEGGADPVVIQGHIELLHTQAVHAARTPDFTTDAELRVYQFDGDDSTWLPLSGPTLVDTHTLHYAEGTAPTFTTVTDLAGAALDGVLLNPFVFFAPSGWQFSSGYQNTDNLRIRVVTTVDTVASFYVWRPPRYRLPLVITTDPARRLWPRDDDTGPAHGRSYPPPNTQQSGFRFGSGAPL